MTKILKVTNLKFQMPISKSDILQKLNNSFPDSKFTLIDLMGDENHYQLEVSGQDFEGKSRIEKHRMINKSLEGCLGDALHALTIKFK